MNGDKDSCGYPAKDLTFAAAKDGATEARKEPDPNCGFCKGKGVVDSGGTTPWDAPIDVACFCTYTATAVVAHSERREYEIGRVFIEEGGLAGKGTYGNPRWYPNAIDRRKIPHKYTPQPSASPTAPTPRIERFGYMEPDDEPTAAAAFSDEEIARGLRQELGCGPHDRTTDTGLKVWQALITERRKYLDQLWNTGHLNDVLNKTVLNKNKQLDAAEKRILLLETELGESNNFQLVEYREMKAKLAEAERALAQLKEEQRWSGILLSYARRGDEEETIEDGFGSVWSRKCPACEIPAMQVVRPGSASCAVCDGNGLPDWIERTVESPNGMD